MKIKRALAGIAAFTALSVAPAAVFAQTTAPGDPVVLNHVQVSLPYSVGNGEATVPGSIHLSFRNTHNVVATDVLFVVRVAAMNPTYIDDAGTFSQNVDVRQTLADESPANGQTVAIERVKFADGTQWVSHLGFIPAPLAPAGPLGI
jgi:hypothetical protein